jgi:hypothetical protein
MQKVIIDVPNLSNPQNIVNGSIASALITKAYKNGIFIPKNATNGDVIRALFPNLYSYDGKDYVLLDLSGFCGGKIETKWWGAPYKVKSEE